MSTHIITGKSGETLAQKYLRALGYYIEGTNVRLGHDELDLIAYDKCAKTLVFIEVKTRSRIHDDYSPLLGMTHDKKKHIQRAARKWIAEKNYEGAYRMDILSIADGKILDHLEDIEWLED